MTEEKQAAGGQYWVFLRKLRLHWGEALSLRLGTSTAPSSARFCTRSHRGLRFSELACTYSALILLDDEVMVMEDKINALIKAAGVNVEPFWPGLFAKALAKVNMGSLICKAGAGGPAPAAGVAQGEGPSLVITAAPAKKKVKVNKKESEESDDDMGFCLFD
ncbi:60S acidic ribosomal protein P1-like [Sturnira hondurensis]|uniref:60S acidic ribosomal protein P1-like n=1 Tax=Sturnira hondurensis TaxID=192404 RepID=UPI001879D3F5|nr:60S acidic ribosomal protein P1-like [Sturnira hondurensis]